MKRGLAAAGPVRVAAWAAVYVTLCALPLAVAALAPVPPARGFWIEFGVALGFLALAMMGFQFVLIGRFGRITRPFGMDTLLHFHRQAGLAAFVLVLGHVAVLIAADPRYAAFLDPRVDAARALALSAVLASVTLLIATTIWRRPLGISYDHWRFIHGVLALTVVGIGLVHVLRVGHYVSVPWKQVAWLVVTGAAMGLLVHVRVIKPLGMRRRPYAVVEVRPERGRAWTLALEPVGHPAVRFEAGQFAWLILRGSPFSLAQHPFSFSSSARRHDRLEFTIKELGDFTSTIGATPPGTRAYLEGPYGTFTLGAAAPRAPAAFLAGGVGITPVMSILRTLRDVGDRRPLRLVYATSSMNSAIFADELHSLAGDLDLQLTHVLEEPPPGWSGETGYLTDEMLKRLLPEGPSEGWEYFVCGPDPMMDIVEAHLVDRGVPLRRIHSERFNIA